MYNNGISGVYSLLFFRFVFFLQNSSVLCFYIFHYINISTQNASMREICLCRVCDIVSSQKNWSKFEYLKEWVFDQWIDVLLLLDAPSIGLRSRSLLLFVFFICFFQNTSQFIHLSLLLHVIRIDRIPSSAAVDSFRGNISWSTELLRRYFIIVLVLYTVAAPSLCRCCCCCCRTVLVCWVGICAFRGMRLSIWARCYSVLCVYHTLLQE